MLDATSVRESLRHLSTFRPKIFGANGHHFLLNPVLPEEDISAFEHHHHIRLPADYRHFLTAIGNGGAGPFYGVFPLGRMDGMGEGFKSWTENDGFIGALSEPFPLAEEWNDLEGKPADELLDEDESEYEKQLDKFDKRYFNSSRVNGAIPICHIGCALRIWLVVSGTQAGRLWRDGRAEYTGIIPLRLEDGSRATFAEWYRDWLDESLRQAGISGRK